MSRLTPTVNSTLYSGVHGDQRVKHVAATIAGTITDASASDGGALLTPSQLSMSRIDFVSITPKFTEDSIEEYAVSYGPASDQNGWVISLLDKGDNLETDADTAVTGVEFYATVYGV